MAKLLKALEEEYRYDSFSLGVMDYYQMVHQLRITENLDLPINTQIKNQDEMYRNWQNVDEEQSLLSQIDLAEWERLNCSSRSLSEIAAGNQLVRQWERTQYTLPISTYWESRVLHDTIKWCEDYFEEFNPTVVISIERFELANSIFFEICKRQGIPMLTFVSSRIGSRWILREDFGYGMSDKTLSEVSSASRNIESMNLASQMVERMREKNSGSYHSDSRVLANKMDNPFIQKIIQVVIETRRLAGNIYARHFIEPKNYALKVRRFEENHLKLTKYLIRRHFIRSARLFGFMTLGTMITPESPYLFWALHYRPETSGLVLGDGRDEIEELMRVAEMLPKGWVLAVKENSLMVGERFPGFYERLKRVEKIVLVDANANTIELVKRSCGVVGISGTVILEAAALGIPACAMGQPEFNKMLTHTGWNSVEGFINDLLSGSQFNVIDQAKIVEYMAYVVSNSSEEDVKYLSDEHSPKLEIMMRRFAQEVHKKLSYGQN
jgi:hypothetical protein